MKIFFPAYIQVTIFMGRMSYGFCMHGKHN